MRYSKLSLDELKEATKDTKAAIEHGQGFLKALPRLPKSKAFEKLAASTTKIVHKLEREAEKLERVHEKKSAKRARDARVENEQ